MPNPIRVDLSELDAADSQPFQVSANQLDPEPITVEPGQLDEKAGLTTPGVLSAIGRTFTESAFQLVPEAISSFAGSIRLQREQIKKDPALARLTPFDETPIFDPAEVEAKAQEDVKASERLISQERPKNLTTTAEVAFDIAGGAGSFAPAFIAGPFGTAASAASFGIMQVLHTHAKAMNIPGMEEDTAFGTAIEAGSSASLLAAVPIGKLLEWLGPSTLGSLTANAIGGAIGIPAFSTSTAIIEKANLEPDKPWQQFWQELEAELPKMIGEGALFGAGAKAIHIGAESALNKGSIALAKKLNDIVQSRDLTKEAGEMATRAASPMASEEMAGGAPLEAPRPTTIPRTEQTEQELAKAKVDEALAKQEQVQKQEPPRPAEETVAPVETPRQETPAGPTETPRVMGLTEWQMLEPNSKGAVDFPHEQIAKEIPEVNTVKPGEVVLKVSDVDKDTFTPARALIGQFIDMFKLPMKVVLTDLSAIAKEGERADFDAAHLTTDKGVSLIFISPEALKGPRGVSSLAHEFGHALMAHVFNGAGEEIKLALRTAFMDFLKDMPKRKIEDIYKEFLPASEYATRIAEMLTPEERSGYIDALSDKGKQYFAFSEWLANQFARWAETNKKPVTLIERFFERMKGILRKLHERFGDQFAPNKTFEQWINSLVKAPDELFEPVKQSIDTLHNEARDKLARRLTNALAGALGSGQKAAFKDELASAINDIPKEHIEVLNDLLDPYRKDGSLDKEMATALINGFYDPIGGMDSGGLIEALREAIVPDKAVTTQSVQDWEEILASEGLAPLDDIDKWAGLHLDFHTKGWPDKEYTTLLLERLPQKGMIKKDTIMQQLARGDVRKAERDLVTSVLNGFAGESVDRTKFEQSIKRALTPLEAYDTMEYADYGITQIRGEPDIVGMPGELNIRDEVSNYRSRVWRMPYNVNPETNHFRDDQYFAHTRSFDEGGTRHVIEVQSDIIQKEHGVSEARIERATSVIARMKEDVELAKEALAGDARALYSLLRSEGLLAGNEDATLATSKGYLEEYIRTREERIADNEIAIAGMQAGPSAVTNFTGQVKNTWHELILREEVRMAAQGGIKTMRVATADTVAKVEGWPEAYTATEAEGVKAGSYVLTGEFTPGTIKGEFVFVTKDGFGISTKSINLTEGQADALKEIAQKAMASQEPRIPEQVKGIYDRYASDIANFVKREFSAKETADQDGHTWLEFEVPPEAALRPVAQFAGAGSLPAYKIAKIHDVLDHLSAASIKNHFYQRSDQARLAKQTAADLDRFGWFTKTFFNLQQIAKRNPYNTPLTNFVRHAMEMWADKMEVESRANKTLIDWRRLGKERSGVLSQALIEETLNGKYFTKRELAAKGLDQSAIDIYNRVHDDFRYLLDQMETAAIQDAIKLFTYGKRNLLLTKGKTAITVVTDIKKKFNEMRAKPYFPIARFGDYGVVVTAAQDFKWEGKMYQSGKRIAVELYETEFEQRARIGELKKELGTKAKVYDFYPETRSIQALKGLPPQLSRMIADRLMLTPEQLKDLKELEYDLAPANSFIKHLKRRTGIAGFSSDGMRAYAAYFQRGANWLSRLKHMNRLDQDVQDAKDRAKQFSSQGLYSRPSAYLAKYMQDRLEYIRNPESEWSGARAFGFIWYLGFNLKSAFINATQPALLTYPYLAARYGDVPAIRSMTAAYLKVGLQGFGGIPAWVAEKYGMKFPKPKMLRPDEVKLFEDGTSVGFLDESQASMLSSWSDPSALSRMLDAGGPLAMRKWPYYSSWFFQQAELINRKVTALAAYNLARENGLGYDEAFKIAHDATDVTQFEYARWNRPEFTRGKKGAMFLFAQYEANVLHFAFGGDPGWTRFWAVQLLLGGIYGLPGAEDVFDLLDFIRQRLSPNEPINSRNDMEDKLKEWAAEYIAELHANIDVLTHGIGRYSFGLSALGAPSIDLSGSISMGHLRGQPSIGGTPESFTVGLFERIAGPLGSLLGNSAMAFYKDFVKHQPDKFKAYQQAIPPFLAAFGNAWRSGDPDVLPGVNEVLPYWLQSRGGFYDKNGAITLPYDPEDKIASAEHRLKYLNFTSTRENLKHDADNDRRAIVDFYTARRSNLLTELAIAYQVKDREAMADARAAIRNFNEEIPDRELAITSDEMRTSLKRKLEENRKTELESPRSKRFYRIYRELQER